MIDIMFLDAQTVNAEYRITAFGDSLCDLTRDFADWVKEQGFTQKDVWYADLFEYKDHKPKHIGSINISGPDSFELVPAPKDSKLSPYKRKMGIKQWLRVKRTGFIRKIHWLIGIDEEE